MEIFYWKEYLKDWKKNWNNYHDNCDHDIIFYCNYVIVTQQGK